MAPLLRIHAPVSIFYDYTYISNVRVLNAFTYPQGKLSFLATFQSLLGPIVMIRLTYSVRFTYKHPFSHSAMPASFWVLSDSSIIGLWAHNPENLSLNSNHDNVLSMSISSPQYFFLLPLQQASGLPLQQASGLEGSLNTLTKCPRRKIKKTKKLFYRTLIVNRKWVFEISTNKQVSWLEVHPSYWRLLIFMYRSFLL